MGTLAGSCPDRGSVPSTNYRNVTEKRRSSRLVGFSDLMFQLQQINQNLAGLN